MISIITAIFNQLSMNKIFYEYLKRYTHNKFELIIVDNGSTDGSAEFFESIGAKVIRNGENYSYPYSQNRGIEQAQSEWLYFLNNDVIVSKDWDLHLMESMEVNNLEVATVCGVEHLENRAATRKVRRRWNRIKGIIAVLGRSRLILKLAHKLMYLNWEQYTGNRYRQFRHQVKKGFVGNTVVIKRSALEKIGWWDERMQVADFDLYLRTIERAETVGDIKPVHICLDTFIHHYIQLTAKIKYPPFKDKGNLIGLSDKWSPEMLAHFKAMNN